MAENDTYNTDTDSYYFGYQPVAADQKQAGIGAVFTRVAKHYDLMNDLMSFGLHRWWKHYTLNQAQIRVGQQVCDLAAGTGDMAQHILPKLGQDGHVYLVDSNIAMLTEGRCKLLDAGWCTHASYVVADAASLPFPEQFFDRVIIGFGLRNFVDVRQALSSIRRVLKPGGKLLILEFSKPVSTWLTYLYDYYSFYWVPRLGQWVLDDAASYRYLVESIRMHPDQATLLDMMQVAGFEDSRWDNLAGGIVALHQAYVY